MSDCKNCGYYWYDEAEGFNMCHYPENEPQSWAPCAQSEDDARREREKEYWEGIIRQEEYENENY